MENKEFKIAYALGYLSFTALTAAAVGAGWTFGTKGVSKVFDRKKKQKKIIKES